MMSVALGGVFRSSIAKNLHVLFIYRLHVTEVHTSSAEECAEVPDGGGAKKARDTSSNPEKQVGVPKIVEAGCG